MITIKNVPDVFEENKEKRLHKLMTVLEKYEFNDVENLNDDSDINVKSKKDNKLYQLICYEGYIGFFYYRGMLSIKDTIKNTGRLFDIGAQSLEEFVQNINIAIGHFSNSTKEIEFEITYSDLF